MTTAYNGTSVMRGIRLINGRQQVLLQDEITGATGPIQWRMHTNATVTMANGNRTAILTLGGQTMQVILQSENTGVFTTLAPVRYPTDPPLPTDAESQDQPNVGVTVLAIELDPGTYTVEVLFNPQWPNFSASNFVTPPSVPLSGWTLTSHNS